MKAMRPIWKHYKYILPVLSAFIIGCVLMWWLLAWRAIPLPLSPSVAEEYQMVLVLPENNRESLDIKLHRLELFQQKYLPELCKNAWQIQRQLLQKQQQIKAAETYECLQHKISEEKNPFRVDMELKLAGIYLQGSSYEAWWQQLNKHNEAHMRQWLQSHIVEVNLLLQEKRLVEITTRTVPNLLKVITSAWEPLAVSDEQRQIWSALITAYEHFSAEDDLSLVTNQSLDQMQLQYYQEQFDHYLKKFKRWVYLREYDLAQKGLENIWESVHSMENIPPEASLIQELRGKLKEVQSVKALFSIANEGAKSKVGTNYTVVLRNGATFLGRIVHYALGSFEIRINDEKKIQIPLNELRGEDIVEFALHHKRNKYVYEYAGIFYCYEGKLELARQAFRHAVDEGADAREIDAYLHKIQER
jgi:hypothetical protein